MSGPDEAAGSGGANPGEAPLVIGTAGHVDHGKTVLVRALTGQDTDRLPEEKARGISIDLGFAYCALPSGRQAAVVDVPGHERFIRNMVAGAGGTDIALLVVAADEGPMPQTYEHLEILGLLGLQAGIIVITKTDLVEPAWLELVQEEMGPLTAGTFLADAPVVPVAAETGAGMDRLLDALDDLAGRVPGRQPGDFARLPIDRVFTMTGFGTVVTGTLLDGTLARDQILTVLPVGREVRVRGLQVHGEDVARVGAARRVAVNLSGVETDELQRGDVLAEPEVLRATPGFAASLRHLASAERPLVSGQRVRVHAGTAELIGRLHLLDADALEPGGQAFVQFRGETPVVTAAGDRYIVRTFSPMRTIGGGQVLDPDRRYRRYDEAGLARLRLRAAGGPARFLAELSQGGSRPRQAAEVGRRFLLGPAASRRLGQSLVEDGRAVALAEGLLLAAEGMQALTGRMDRLLADFHRRHPLRRGMPRQALRQQLMARAEPREFHAVLEHLAAAGRVQLDGELVARSGWAVELGEEEKAARQAILARLAAEPYGPPDAARLGAGLPLTGERARQLLHYLEESGEVVALEEGLYLHRDAFAGAWAATEGYLREHGRISVADLRDLLGTTRKYAVPLLETFDARRYTRRVGDERLLRQGAPPANRMGSEAGSETGA